MTFTDECTLTSIIYCLYFTRWCHCCVLSAH